MKRVTRSSSHRCIPQDLFPEILSYLPAKSLLRFQSVSKEWKSIIDDPDFVYFHLKRYRSNVEESKLIIQTEIIKPLHPKNTPLSIYSSNTFQEISSIKFPESQHKPWTWKIHNSINGLLLQQRYRREWEVMIWNPSIRKTFHLPLHRPNLPTLGGMQTIYCDPYRTDMCLGFDPSTRDYKALAIIHERNTIVKAMVFSLNTSSWREPLHRETVGYEKGFKSLYMGFEIIYVEGSGHWIAKDEIPIVNGVKERFCMVSFDFCSEKFSSTALPSVVSAKNTHLLALGCSVGLMIDNSIWVLESDSSSIGGMHWSHLYEIELKHMNKVVSMKRPIRFVYLKKDGSSLFVGKINTYAYDIKNQRTTKVVSKTFSSRVIRCIGAHVESLVLWNK